MIKQTSRGFTLIEIMVVVAIIAILAVIAMPRFAGLMDKSKESTTVGMLTSLRSALNIYYGDNTNFPGDDLASLTSNGRYIANIPMTKLPGTPHMDSSAISVGASTAAALTDSGGWAYVNDPESHYYGTIFVNCSHLDRNGNPWYSR